MAGPPTKARGDPAAFQALHHSVTDVIWESFEPDALTVTRTPLVRQRTRQRVNGLAKPVG